LAFDAGDGDGDVRSDYERFIDAAGENSSVENLATGFSTGFERRRVKGATFTRLGASAAMFD
jgi:hypothetical protein